ncbi:MAG: SH3 domain-containing protein [Prevotellaceae bacterium]|jgi:uncharacterized protein YgiM (DUF1202 family)|nr:SH3 domain-containing protein [Prevotellaceae bacterium]
MAEYDERYGAWRDKAGGIHYDPGYADAADKGIEWSSKSSSEYTPVDLNSPEYNRKYPDYSAQSTLTAADYEAMAQESADRVLRPVNLALKFEKEGFEAMKKLDYKEVAECFTMVYDILNAPNWSEYYDTFYERNPNLSPEVWDSLYADRDRFREQAAVAWMQCAMKAKDKDDFDAAVRYATEAVVLGKGKLRESSLGIFGTGLFFRADEYDKKGKTAEAIADYKRAAHSSETWREHAVKKLAEKGIEYTPGPIRVTDRTTPPAVVEMIDRAIAEMDDIYSSGSKRKKSTSNSYTTSHADESIAKKGGIIPGVILGIVCSFLSIIGIGSLWMLVTGAADPEIGIRNTLVYTAIIAAVFTFVWRKRKWLWIILIFLCALFGMYVLVGAPGLNIAKTETVRSAATATVTATTLNLRATPSTSGAIVAKLAKGSRLTVTGKAANGWIAVEYNGKKGYVGTQYIKVK